MEFDQILQCVNDEPEFPDDPTEEMKEVLQTALQEKDVDLLVECLRITVRLTKQGIADRIRRVIDGMA